MGFAFRQLLPFQPLGTLHFPPQHISFLPHLLLTSWLPLLRIRSRPTFRSFISILQMLPNITLFPVHHIIDRVRPTSIIQITLAPRDYVHMQMRDGLPCIWSILNSNVETSCFVASL